MTYQQYTALNIEDFDFRALHESFGDALMEIERLTAALEESRRSEGYAGDGSFEQYHDPLDYAGYPEV